MANKILEGSEETFESLTSSLNETAKTYLGLEKIIPRVIDLFVDQADDVRMLNKELGSGSRLASEFRKEILQVSTTLGISSRETLRLVEATKEYHQGVTDSTKATLNFQKATGVSIGILGKLTAKINILGNISKEANEQMYTNILSVREAYGLTDNQIEDIIVTLTNYAVATQASDEQIVRASTSLSKFTSLLTSAGIEADRVSEILDGMLDPDRMLDNVVLLNKIGISVNDMVSGNPIEKLEGSVDKLKELGQEIANIAKTNRLQASELAKVYNLTLQEAIQLSELDTSEKALNTQKKLEEYRNETTSLIKSLDAFKERLMGGIAMFINPILKGFESLEGSLGTFSKGLVSIGTLLVGKFILGKLKEGVMSLFGEAAKKFGVTMGEYLTKVQDRAGAKAADMAGLTPKLGGRSVGNYGWGLTYSAKSGLRRDEYNRRTRLTNRNGEVDSGEIINAIEAQKDQLNMRVIQYAGLKTKEEKTAFEGTFGAIKDITAQLNKLKDVLEETNKGYNADLTERVTSFKNSKEENKSKTATHLAMGFLKSAGINAESFGIDASNNKQVAEIISGSNNIKDALTGLYDFFKEKNMGEQVLKVSEALSKLDDQVIATTNQLENAKNVLKSGEKISEGKVGSTFGNRIRMLGKGIITDIGTVLYKVRDTLRPTNLLKGLGKGLKFGALGLLGGVGVKFMASLSKNEKFQESMTTISEKISTIFDGLVAAVEPIIEPVANAIMGIFNFLQPAIDWLSKIIGKITGLFGGVLNKSVSSISKNVTTISDSYKQEDLKTMVAATALKYDKGSDSLAVQMGDVVNLITGISKKIDEGNLLAITNGQSK